MELKGFRGNFVVMSVSLVAVSSPVVPGLATAEDLIAYAARVSNPTNQSSPDRGRLLKYCIDHGHWSVFETATMTVEIETTRAVASQILRHRSFTFQEFSQRYAVVETDPEPQAARSPDPKNRQASRDDLPDDVKDWWREAQREAFAVATDAYLGALDRGIAKESARFVLPLATPTKLYMTGNVRDWIHYIRLRTGNGTQPEHVEVAEGVKAAFVGCFPCVSRAMGWIV